MLKLDRTDIRILHELQKNGRITNAKLAEHVYLSPSPCLARVKKLEKAGYISGYSALIDIAQLGPVITVFTEITLGNHRQPDFDRFQRAVKNIDECVECHLMSGGYDYLLKFITRDISSYQSIIETLSDSGVGIDKYFSFVVMKSSFVKQNPALVQLFSDLQ